MNENFLNALICVAMGLLTALPFALPLLPPTVLDIQIHLETERQP